MTLIAKKTTYPHHKEQIKKKKKKKRVNRNTHPVGHKYIQIFQIPKISTTRNLSNTTSLQNCGFLITNNPIEPKSSPIQSKVVHLRQKTRQRWFIIKHPFQGFSGTYITSSYRENSVKQNRKEITRSLGPLYHQLK
jgi:hypothetical protein